jgi:hypothetical protein
VGVSNKRQMRRFPNDNVGQTPDNNEAQAWSELQTALNAQPISQIKSKSITTHGRTADVVVVVVVV